MARNTWIDYLRTVLTVLVVAHHAGMAYATFAFFDTDAYIRSTSPVVDEYRWIGLDVFIVFNDTFFMPLMFFISGLFVFYGLQKKGALVFIKDRCLRLGLPFMVAVTFIIPLAYIPSYYISHHSFSLYAFISDYLFVQQWPVGPPWFIWVLLVFNGITALVPRHIYLVTGQWFIVTANVKPLWFFAMLFLIVLLCYAPVSLATGHYAWTGFGPFDFQVNRILLYFIFFTGGVALGSTQWELYLFKGKLLLGLPCKGWALIGLCAFVLLEVYTYSGVNGLFKSVMQSVIYSALFILCCICISLAFLIIFKTIIKKNNPLMDSLAKDAYGIYLLHYIPVSWLQFALTGSVLPAICKFLIVFVISLCSSWGAVYFLRKTAVVRRFI